MSDLSDWASSVTSAADIQQHFGDGWIYIFSTKNGAETKRLSLFPCVIKEWNLGMKSVWEHETGEVSISNLQVASFLYHQEKMNVLVEPDVHDTFARIPGFGFVQTIYSQDTSDLHVKVDFVACLGGDGVILHASNLFRGVGPPIMSFNLGSLGFLTSHNDLITGRMIRVVKDHRRLYYFFNMQVNGGPNQKLLFSCRQSNFEFLASQIWLQYKRFEHPPFSLLSPCFRLYF